MGKIEDVQSFGGAGCEVATNGAIPAGEYVVLDCITDVNLLSITAPRLNGTITGIVLPAGTKIYTPFTAASATSGTIVAYKAFDP